MSFFDHKFDEGARAIAILGRFLLSKLWQWVIALKQLVER